MPAESPSGLQKLLQDRRNAILDELRKDKPDLVKELLQLDIHIALAASDSNQSDEYIFVRSPLDAILDYLDKVGHALPKASIAKDIEARGYGRGTLAKPYQILMDTFRYHLEVKKDKPGKKKIERKIIERNGLIGKTEWPVKLFKPPNEKAEP